MTRAGPETRLDHRIVKAVLAEYPGSWVLKVHGGPYQTEGVPDLLFCVHGLLVGMEVKCQGPGESEAHARERTTLTQRVQIARINKAGGIAATVLSPAEGLALVARGLEKRRREDDRG